MVMKPCPECDREVSQRATVCHGCGYPTGDAQPPMHVTSTESAGEKPIPPLARPLGPVPNESRLEQEINRKYSQAYTRHLFWWLTHYFLLTTGITAAFLATSLGAKSWYDDKPAIQPQGEGAPFTKEDRVGWNYTVRWMAGLAFFGGVATLLHKGLGVEKNLRRAQHDMAALERIRSRFMHPTKPNPPQIYAEYRAWLKAKETDAKLSSEAADALDGSEQKSERKSKSG